MSRTLIFAIFTLALIGCQSIPKEKLNGAREFNDKLVDHLTPITKDMNAVSNLTNQLMNQAVNTTLNSSDIQVFEVQHGALLVKIDESSNAVGALTEFDPDIKYKEASANYLAVCKSTLKDEYRQLIGAIQQDLSSTNNMIECGNITMIIWERLLNLEKSTKEVQHNFADKYSITLTDGGYDWKENERQFKSFKTQFEQMKSDN